MNKELIKNKFAAAIQTYNEHAIIQQAVTIELCEQIKKSGFTTFDSCLEIGCGTGFLTEKILSNFSINSLCLNDLVSDYQLVHDYSPFKNTNLSYQFGDAENLDFNSYYDAVFSASSFQWIKDFESFVDKLSSILKPSGLLAFSTFGPNNFKELREVTNDGINYHSLNEIKTIVSQKFDLIFCSQNEYILEFKSMSELLQHIKYTGVNCVSDYNMSISETLSFCKNYKKKFTNSRGRVYLSYHPLIIIAQRK